MKLRIIGPSGSGKTFLAAGLSQKYGIPVSSLDDLFWDNSKGAYQCKRDETARAAMLETIRKQDHWIVEGVQFTWCECFFAEADVIYFLDTPAWLCRIRIVRRFLKRKIQKTSRKNETLTSLIQLLKWTRKFYRVNLPEMRKALARYETKVVTLAGKKAIDQLLTSQLF